ncbi:helix-turn-helix domain-containing protein [Eupransor demetentiae]|uniref:SOS-response transcriptional repressor LexA (RecA-mediated autopeptidase) (LexA) n=1 Tax=Eupransor demetentiae TaxID=3109584 RepID=A0ABP0EPG8_9LACO|nr:SOS-response transcriptional repressor LexA (RecA-mediated autopeptidase) (LexA) [Lactobacillaceae bacterium LMG 33000]
MANEIEFGNKIRDIRLMKGYSVRQAAMQGGISFSFLSKVENGHRSIPKVENLYKIAKGLRISNEDILKIAGINSGEADNIVNISEYDDVELPIYGRISAGYPEGAEEDIDGSIHISSDLSKRYGTDKLLALRVDGESMNKVAPNHAVAILAKIDESDCSNGDICGVIIDGESATLKHVYRYPDRIRFEPDSWLPNYKPFEYRMEDVKKDNPPVQIIGKLVHVSYDLNGKHIQ